MATSGPATDPATSVWAVVVTYRRREVLRRTLPAVSAQRRPPDRVVVVDNAGDDGTGRMLAEDFPDVGYLRLSENGGFAAGLAAGMHQAISGGADFLWLLDDDTTPEPDALGRVLQVATTVRGAGVVGLRGGLLRLGSPVHLAPSRTPGAARDCDFTLVDGALVARGAVLAAGYPRGDFFMMLEDVEFTDRIRRAGWRVLVLGEDLARRAHLGSDGPHGSPPWRGYYQTRNQLVMARERRSPAALLGWAIRQVKFAAGIVLRLDRKAERLGLRLAGARDGLRGRMGKTVDPARWA